MKDTPKSDPVKRGVFVPSKDPPPRVDLRPYCSPVEDQSQSNSCCANAAVGAYEYLVWREAAIKNDTPGDVSRLFVYYVGRIRDKQIYRDKSPIADEGMTLTGAIDALTMKGACLDSSWPFDLRKINDIPPSQTFDEAMRYKISEAKEIPATVEAMRACLAEGYPIIFGLKLTEKFFRCGRSGIITTPDPNDPKSAEHGLHAMLIVGYSDAESRFIVRNSWGTDWGDRGYCYIPYDYAANPKFNFLGQYAIYGLTDTDFTPEPADDHAQLIDRTNGDDDDHSPLLEEEEDVEEHETPDEEAIEDLFDPVAEARRAFNKFDTDGSGTLNIRELNRALLLNGTFLKKNELEKLMRKYDTDHSGTLSFDEFLCLPGVLPEGHPRAARKHHH
eukprot:CAMPEP_0174821738 /NCGR_PEP_ID=MMETSP1107-20130205/9234_1 /TAXON_ID=36770 /ORGANISM="Paraphysomonas vestita, Strain GFlagA" /LENGTH=387 /DNA_ID=CAMNT_0016039073 /DNA_START=108 /DNA_END=1271 /DNA_ORIENTATION=+